MLEIKTPITSLPRIGPAIAKKLKKLGILTLKDLLYHFPHRYDDYRKILTISQLKIKGSGVIQGKIIFIANKRSFRQKILITEAIVSDSTDSIKAIWFNQSYLSKKEQKDTIG